MDYYEQKTKNFWPHLLQIGISGWLGLKLKYSHKGDGFLVFLFKLVKIFPSSNIELVDIFPSDVWVN
ncbi:10922_t:CDS:2 [Gigaspora rosea]|nr:10922_t:CDS:2 [Gigaspora rosea]